MHYTLSDMIADLTQNAVEAGSSYIKIDIRETANDLTVHICDNGKGMSEEVLKRVTNPFYTDGVKHPNRKVGLGIPFLIQTVTETGGDWNISSKVGEGTTVSARFDLTNIDTPPIGSFPRLFRQILLLSGDYEMVITRIRAGAGIAEPDMRNYTITRSEVFDALGDIYLAATLSLLGEYLEGLESDSGE